MPAPDSLEDRGAGESSLGLQNIVAMQLVILKQRAQKLDSNPPTIYLISVTQSKSLNTSGPLFLHLYNGPVGPGPVSLGILYLR